MKWNWSLLNNEDLDDEITLLQKVIENTLSDNSKTEIKKEIIVNQCLEKLKSIYDEQRKRGVTRRNKK
jgi:hypothetical protein